MRLIDKIFSWLLRNVPRRTRERERIAEREINELRRKVEREASPLSPKPAANRSPVSMHRAGGAVDPTLFKDAKLAAPELPHSDPASPFYPYWLQSQNGGGIAGFAIEDAPRHVDQREVPDHFRQLHNTAPAHHVEPHRSHHEHEYQSSPVSSGHSTEHSGSGAGGYSEPATTGFDHSGGHHDHGSNW